MTEDVLRKRGKPETNNNGHVPDDDGKPAKDFAQETQFLTRNSSLTLPLESSPHYQAIFNIYFVIQLLLVLDSVVYDYVALGRAVRVGPIIKVVCETIIISHQTRTKSRAKASITVILFLSVVVLHSVLVTRINLGVTAVTNGFGDYKRGFRLWFFEFAVTLAFYAGLRLYDYGAKNIKSESLYAVWKFFGIIGVIMTQLILIGVPSYDIYTKYLAVGSATAVSCEMFRFAMKIHAVAVSCGPRCRPGTVPLPSFSHYLYFLFAPTLVYRDKYPLSLFVRWDRVVSNFAQVAGLLFINGYLWQRFVWPYWSDYGKESTVDAAVIVRNIFASVLPGILSFVTVFYCILHCWFNAFAELMRFADKLFYEEWWTASRFSWFYRAWNRVVHSWLREYIYTPLAPLYGRGVAVLAVFVVSGVVHEIIIALAFGFFFPVMLILFVFFGLLMIPITATSGRRYPGLLNFTLWMCLFIGNGILWSFYPMEYFARQNCPPSESDSFFVPKCLSCPKIVFNDTPSYIY